MSFMRDHQRRVETEQELKTGNVEAVVASPNSLHVQLAALRLDVERLRSHSQQRADRIAMKRDELLPKWMPWAEQYLESGDVFNNPVFSYCVNRASDVPGPSYQGTNHVVAQYRKAVFARAKADLMGEWKSVVRVKDDAQAANEDTQDSLLAEANFALRSLKGLSRVGVSIV